jgi:hypothetical protein
MSFYKVIKDGIIVGVCTDDEFRRFQVKHSIIVVSGPDSVEAVDFGGTLYHDAWMEDTRIPCEQASVIQIEAEEYNGLKAQLDAGGIPDDGSLEEERPAEQEPAEAGEEEGGEEVRKTAAQILREQIESIDSQVKLAARFASV